MSLFSCCSSGRAARRKAWRRAANSTASKSKLAMDWRPKSASISWTISFWRSVWSPFFRPLLWWTQISAGGHRTPLTGLDQSVRLIAKPSVGGNLLLRFLHRDLGNDLRHCLARYRMGQRPAWSMAGIARFGTPAAFPHRRYRATSDPGRISPAAANPAFNSAALCSSY